MTHVHLCGWCAIPSRYLLSRAKRPRPLRLVPGWAVVPWCSMSMKSPLLQKMASWKISIHRKYMREYILSIFITCHGSSLISNDVFTCGGTKDLLEQLIIVGLPTSTACQPSADMATGCFSQRKRTWSWNLQIFTLKLNSVGCGFDTAFRYRTGCVAPSVGFFPGQSACTGDCIYRESTFASCSNCRTNGLTNKNKTYKKTKRTSLNKFPLSCWPVVFPLIWLQILEIWSWTGTVRTQAHPLQTGHQGSSWFSFFWPSNESCHQVFRAWCQGVVLSNNTLRRIFTDPLTWGRDPNSPVR